MTTGNQVIVETLQLTDPVAKPTSTGVARWSFKAKSPTRGEIMIGYTAFPNLVDPESKQFEPLSGQMATIYETVVANVANGISPWYEVGYRISENNNIIYYNLKSFALSKNSPAPTALPIPPKSDAVRGLEQGNANNVAGMGIASYVSNPNNKKMELPAFAWLKEYADKLNYLSDSIVEGRNAKNNGEEMEEEPEESIEEPEEEPNSFPGNEPGELDI